MKNGIGLEDYENIFIGLIQGELSIIMSTLLFNDQFALLSFISGYQGVYGKALKTVLGVEKSLSQKIFKSGEHDGTFTVEGLFARSGFVAPADTQFKYSVRAALPKEADDFGHVRFKRQYDGRRKEMAVSHDNLVPKYGYIALPHSGRSHDLVAKYKFLTQTSCLQNPANFGVEYVSKFQSRYVSEKHVLIYLGEKSNLSFNSWLSTKYPQHFARGVAVHAIVHNARFDDNVLKRSIPGLTTGMSFSDGNFEQTDFSFCQFKNIAFKNFKGALLVGCTFDNCTATGAALSRANLSFSTMTDCVFRKLTGFLTVEHVNAVHCDFSQCSFTSLDGGAGMGDQFTSKSTMLVT